MQHMATMILAVAPLVLVPALSAHFKASKSHDVDPLCKDNQRVMFNTHSLHYSNLKGYGPDTAMPQGMVISDVFSSGSENHKDLLIRTVEHYYPFNVSANTIKGDVASISMDAASTVELQITFLDRGSREPAAPGRYALTFMNFERLSVEGCRSYDLSGNSRVQVASEGRHDLSFTSSARKVAPTRAFELTDDELAGAVMLQCIESSITVEVTMRQGQTGDNLYITGSSNVACPARTTCEGYNCLPFFLPFPNNADIYCATEAATLDDLRTCCYEQVPTMCESKHTIMFGPDSLQYSNLGGNGPDVDKPEGVRYTDVFPKSSDTVDMIFNAVSEYTSVDSKEHRRDPTLCDMSHNGLHGKYGRLTVGSGSRVRMDVNFRSHKTNEPVAITSGFFFTVYDFDQQFNGGGQETLRISGYDFYKVSANTTVSVVAAKGGKLRRGVFRSTVAGTKSDNPKHPSKLSDEELDKSVTFGFPSNTSNFTMELEVGDGFAARNFEFTGFSVLPCPFQAQCSSIVCPAGYKSRPDPDTILCQEAICTYNNDRDTCCVEEIQSRATCDSMLCPEGYDLRERAASLKCKSEICMESESDTCCIQSQGFSTTCTRSRMLVLSDVGKTWMHNGSLFANYINVFPYLNRTINMKTIFSTDTAELADMPEITPSIQGSLCRVPLPNATNVQLELLFIDPKGNLIEDMPDFSFTLFGGSMGVSSPRTVTLPDGELVPWTLSEDTSVVALSNNSFVLGSLGADAVKRLESSSLFALDGQARKTGISWVMNSSFKLRIDTRPPDGDFFLRGPGASAVNDSADGVVFFGGESSLTCNPRATCAEYLCPSGFTLRDNAKSLACNGEACTGDDSTTCCDCDPSTAFLMDSTELREMALGDKDADDEVIVISNVFPGSGHQIHLRVKALTDYFTGNASLNTLIGGFLNFNVRTSSETTFRFGFVDNDGKPTRVPFPFVFSAFDIDQQDDGGAQEQLTVNSIDWFVTSENSKVGQDLDNELPIFRSLHAGQGWDNPTNPLHLSDRHLENSVSFMMKEGVENVDVTIKVKDGFAARNILFAGQSNLLCSVREVCSNFACPAGKSLVSRASLQWCHAEVCTAQDEEQCCRDADIEDGLPVATKPDLPGPVDAPIEVTSL